MEGSGMTKQAAWLQGQELEAGQSPAPQSRQPGFPKTQANGPQSGPKAQRGKEGQLDWVGSSQRLVSRKRVGESSS